MRIFYLILVILFLFFGITFSQLNSGIITIKYYYMKDINAPIYIIIFAALLLGVIITWFFSVVERFRLNRTISKLNKTIRTLKKELRANETPPVVDQQQKTNDV